MTATTTATAANDQAHCEPEPADWQVAGDAWAHAATDWAYRFEPFSRDAVEHIFATLDVATGTQLLDVACGSGYALARADRLGADLAGLDESAGLLDIARRRVPSADLVAGTMFDLPWDDESFDVVTSINGIWGGCDDAMAEAFRVLRPGGSMALTFWGPGKALDLRDYFIVVGSTAPGVAEEFIGLATIGQPGVCEAMLEGAGFDVVERGATSAFIEAPNADDLWKTLRSAGAAVPSLNHVGEDEFRRQVMVSVEPYRADDGSYRLVNELTHVIARKPEASG